MANFDFDPEKLFPGLNFYPRIEYRRSIISLARWYIDKSDIAQLISEPLSISRMHLFCRDREIPVRIAAGRGDQQLVFDLSNDAEAMFFLQSLSEKTDLMITEFLGGSEGKEDSSTYFNHQYVVSLINKERVYHAVQGKSETISIRRDFSPGSEWIYVKIYSTYESANPILLDELLPWLHRNKHLIRQWFFVRYYDTDPHLRLRLRVALDDVKNVQFGLQAHIEHAREKGLVQRAYYDTYQRELERYGAGLIEDVEKLFFTGSECVVRYLTANREKEDREGVWPITHCYQMVWAFFKGDYEQIISISRWSADAFFKEHGGEKKLQRSMDNRYRELRPALIQALEHVGNNLENVDEITGAVRDLALSSLIIKPTKRNKLIADMVHMQVNRIYSSEQRRHEAFIWHCLLKFALMAVHKQTKLAAALMDDS